MTEAISLLKALKLQSSRVRFAAIPGPQIGESPAEGYAALLWRFDVKLQRKKSLISALTPKWLSSLAPLSESSLLKALSSCLLTPFISPRKKHIVLNKR